jgi:hypothetical protein
MTAWTSLTNADLLLSLRVPVGWVADIVDEFRFRVCRDGADDGGFRASCGFVLGEPEVAGPEWFAEFCAAVPRQLAATIEGFEPIGTESFDLSSGATVFAVSARAHVAGAPPTSQLLAYVWANSYRMYVMDASTLRTNETRDLPLFQAILGSIRVLPPRL